MPFVVVFRSVTSTTRSHQGPIPKAAHVFRLIQRFSILLSFTCVMGCGTRAGKTADVKIRLELAPNPPRVGTSTITTRILDPAGQPVTGATIKLEGNMNHAGMVPTFSTPREVRPGEYVGDLEFTMGGDWYIEVNGHLADDRVLEYRVDVPGVKTP